MRNPLYHGEPLVLVEATLCSPRLAGAWWLPLLKSVRQIQTHRAWFYGMKVYIRYSLSRLAWQT